MPFALLQRPPRCTIPKITDSHQNQQDNRLTFVKTARADLRNLRSDCDKTPSPGSAALNGSAMAEKVLPLHRKQLYQALHIEAQRVISVEDGLHKGREQVS